jgi:ribosomal 50S subunit-associated protein YjgA (DUF615 family)
VQQEAVYNVKYDEQEDLSGQLAETNSADFRQEVDEIREIVNNVVHDAPFTEKVHSLYDIIEEISQELKCRRNGQSGSRLTSLQSLESLRQHVDDLHQEWNSVAATLHTQRERLEALLDSFPGAIETSTVRALSLRVSHLEQLVAQLVEESRAESTAKGSRTQLYVSLAALGTTVVLWGAWITLGILG